MAVCICLIVSTSALYVPAAVGKERVSIVRQEDCSFAEMLAAKEIRRYLYLRTGRLVSIVAGERAPTDAEVIIIGQKDRAVVANELIEKSRLKSLVNSLRPQQFVIRTLKNGDSRKVLIAGGDESGTLYGAYRFIEHLGVRFFLHGDVVPDERITLELGDLDEIGRPLFDLRGLNPWGSHAEGMDLWGPEEYKTIFSQMAKMRMNFVGIHCYPEGHPFAEPLVWTGIEGDFDKRGNVTFSYPSSYFNSLRDKYWGYRPKKTSDYSFGASLLFERDDWGPEVMAGYCPLPETEAEYNDVFNRMGRILSESFTFAKRLNVKTCIGTEAPLTIPGRLVEKLKSKGKDPNAASTIREIYEGMFQRIMRTHPLDYYWIWTNENWTWRGNTSGESGSVASDITTALAALKNLQAPFKLATAGWVLGPKDDRAAFDRIIPKEIALSAISRTVGHEPVDPAFGDIRNREKWAIPWLEDDPALTSPQLWVGRTRKDAADALAYRCTGLMGLHWRTRILGPNASALAQACWDQSGWNPRPGEIVPSQLAKPTRADGPIAGKSADYPGKAIARTDDDPLYQTCRYDMKGYRIKVPDGVYRVTLKFCEPHFSSAGKRVCDVKVQGKVVIEELDVFAQAGQFAALDYSFEDVPVSEGQLAIDFVYRVSLPCISAIIIENADESFTRKINCSGPAYQDYEPDNLGVTPTTRGKERGLASDDFYADWALACFGSRAAKQAAAIFQEIDGRLPRTSDWVGGAGGIKPDKRPWQKVAAEFDFVERLAKLRGHIESPGSLERFDYWLDTFRYHRAQAKVRCAFARFNEAASKVEAEKDMAKRKALAEQTGLGAYAELIESVGQAYRYQLSAVSTYGGIATIMNWEGHIGPTLIGATGRRMEKLLGKAVPAAIRPDREYQGPPRIIVPTVRTNLVAGESLNLKVIALDNQRPKQIALYWRKMGQDGKMTVVDLNRLGRAVYSVSLAEPKDDFEYYIKAVTSEGKELYFPATAPKMNQTVVVTKAD